jgi:hypothetical protein
MRGQQLLSFSLFYDRLCNSQKISQLNRIQIFIHLNLFRLPVSCNGDLLEKLYLVQTRGLLVNVD